MPGGLSNRATLKCLDRKFHLEPGSLFPGKSIMRTNVFSGQANFKESKFPDDFGLPGKTPGGCVHGCLEKHHLSSQACHCLCSENSKLCQRVQILQRQAGVMMSGGKSEISSAQAL